MAAEPMTDAFDASGIIERVLLLHEASGDPPVKGRVWERPLPGGGWYMAVNGRGVACRVTPPQEGMPFDVPPFEFAFWWHGWLAGSLSPVTGGLLADGAEANAETLCAALDEARREFPTITQKEAESHG